MVLKNLCKKFQGTKLLIAYKTITKYIVWLFGIIIGYTILEENFNLHADIKLLILLVAVRWYTQNFMSVFVLPYQPPTEEELEEKRYQDWKNQEELIDPFERIERSEYLPTQDKPILQISPPDKGQIFRLTATNEERDELKISEVKDQNLSDPTENDERS